MQPSSITLPIILLIFSLSTILFSYFKFLPYIEKHWINIVFYCALCMIGQVLFIFSVLLSKPANPKLSMSLFFIYDAVLFFFFALSAVVYLFKQSSSSVVVELTILGMATFVICLTFIKLVLMYDG